jgi:hypothetical protein
MFVEEIDTLSSLMNIRSLDDSYLLHGVDSFFEKLIDSHLVKKFTTFYGTRRFVTAFKTARHLFLS